MKNSYYDKYGNKIEKIHKTERVKLMELKNKYFDVLEEISVSNKCYGDKVREIIKLKITENPVYARKLLEMF